MDKTIAKNVNISGIKLNNILKTQMYTTLNNIKFKWLTSTKNYQTCKDAEKHNKDQSIEIDLEMILMAVFIE